MVTMGDVASKAGVSQATVSFVLGGRADRLKISPQTRERVLQSARELGYQRNQLARAMVTGKSRIMGVLTTPSNSENKVRILTGAMEAASENNYLLKVVHFSYDGVDEATIARCLEWRLAGVLVVGFSDDTYGRIHAAFSNAAIPATMIDNVPAMNWGVRIGSNDEQGIEQAVGHLVKLGHRRIAFVGGQTGLLSEWREQCFRICAASAHLSLPNQWVRHSSWNDPDEIESQVRGLFEDGDALPTAVVCAADTIAMTVLRVARARGLRLPADVSVTGYSNAELGRFADPPLTTVDQSFLEMGRAAALQLIGLVESDAPEEKSPSEKILLPTRLVVRASTAPPPDEKEIKQ